MRLSSIVIIQSLLQIQDLSLRSKDLMVSEISGACGAVRGINLNYPDFRKGSHCPDTASSNFSTVVSGTMSDPSAPSAA